MTKGLGIRACAFALCVATAAPATAATPPKPNKWETCHFEATGGMGLPLARIVLEPFEIAGDSPGGSSAIAAFEEDPGVASVVPGYKRFISSTYDCDVYDRREDAQDKADRRKASTSYNIIRSVQWDPPESVTGLKGPRKKPAVKQVAAAPKPKPKPDDQSGATVVKADTSIRDSVAAWDEQVRKALAAEADRKIAAAAQAAQADARKQAEIRAFFEARRRQGRAQ